MADERFCHIPAPWDTGNGFPQYVDVCNGCGAYVRDTALHEEQCPRWVREDSVERARALENRTQQLKAEAEAVSEEAKSRGLSGMLGTSSDGGQFVPVEETGRWRTLWDRRHG